MTFPGPPPGYPPPNYPPPGYRGYPPPYRPPGSIKTLGILNLVFAGLGSIGLLFTYAMYFGGMRLGPRNPVVEIAHRSPAYMSFLTWSLVLGFVGVVVFVASGIGLVKLKTWGRTLAIWYALYGIVSSIAGIAVTQHYILGPLSESRDAAAGAGMMGGYLGGILGVVYPVILLAFMMSGKVRDAFARAAEPIPPARVV